MKSIRVWHWVVALTVLAAGITWWTQHRKSALRIQYREEVLRRGNLDVNILSTGGVQPENRVDIKPPVAGRVESVLVKEGQKVQKGQILAWMSSSERAALLDAARAKGPEEAKRWEELYRATPIMAPITGTIITKNVEAGQTFSATDSPLVMSDRLTVKAQVDETDIAQIKRGLKADIVLDAYPAMTIPSIVGQIAFDAKTVNNVTTYTVDVLPEKTPPEMRSGMTANVTFKIASKSNVLLVPAEALKVRDGKFFVLRKTENGPTEVSIEVGLTDGKRTEVVGGLAENDTVMIAEIAQKSAPGASSPFSPMGGPRRGSGGR